MFLLAAPSFAQSTNPAPAGPAVTTAVDDSAPVEMSPFEVRPEDVGYQAANTTSGSRLNSRLKDTPAAISPFTPEFLSDIGAVNLQDMLGYALNIEGEFDDSIAGFSNTPGRAVTGGDFNFRIRGQGAGVSRDFVENGAPNDLYNVERAEVTSGPNSILFGIGSTGGLVSLSGKKAQVNRNKTSLKTVIGSWDYHRFEGDYNQVIKPGMLSARLMGVYQNALGWRKWDFSDQKRGTASLTYRPFKSTTVHVSGEKGHTANNASITWNLADSFTRWDAAGRPVIDAAASAAMGTATIGTADRFTFDERAGVVYNLRGELTTSGINTDALLPPHLSPYDFNITGPGAKRRQDFSSWQVQLEHRFPKQVTVEAAYFHNDQDHFVAALNTGNAGLYLRGDPNRTVPNINNTGTIPNPRAGQLYVDMTPWEDWRYSANDVARLTASWEVDLGKWLGRHRIAGLLENSFKKSERRPTQEILVDQDNVPIGNAANPEGNGLTRRNYVTEGDFTTYYGGNPEIAMPSFVFNGRTITSRFVSRTQSNVKSERDTTTYMAAVQSAWLKDRLITTVGYRLDKISGLNWEESRITDPRDPRVTSRRFVLNEWDFDGRTESESYKPTTFTAGAVGHVTRRISLFYNTSRNIGVPSFGRTILPEGKTPPPSDGIGEDFGIMLDLFGDDRYFFRGNFYKTEQINDPSINPNGTAAITSQALGGDNLQNIMLALLNAGKINQQQFDQQAINYNSTTSDLTTTGVELEFVGNPTKNLTYRLAYSKSKRRRGDFFSEIYAFYDEKAPQWRALAADNPALLATVNRELQLIDQDLNNQFNRQNSPFGTRPHKANATMRYKFSEGVLRNAFFGGGLRYQGKNYMGDDAATGRIYWGNESLWGDAFGGYRFRVPRTKATATVQLNVRNISNSYLVTPARYNASFTGYFRLYMAEPRSYRLTTTIDF